MASPARLALRALSARHSVRRAPGACRAFHWHPLRAAPKAPPPPKAPRAPEATPDPVTEDEHTIFSVSPQLYYRLKEYVARQRGTGLTGVRFDPTYVGTARDVADALTWRAVDYEGYDWDREGDLEISRFLGDLWFRSEWAGSEVTEEREGKVGVILDEEDPYGVLYENFGVEEVEGENLLKDSSEVEGEDLPKDSSEVEGENLLKDSSEVEDEGPFKYSSEAEYKGLFKHSDLEYEDLMIKDSSQVLTYEDLFEDSFEVEDEDPFEDSSEVEDEDPFEDSSEVVLPKRGRGSKKMDKGEHKVVEQEHDPSLESADTPEVASPKPKRGRPKKKEIVANEGDESEVVLTKPKRGRKKKVVVDLEADKGEDSPSQKSEDNAEVVLAKPKRGRKKKGDVQ